MDTTSLTAKGTARGEAVLLSGVFGVGKTTVCEELAARLEAAGRPYGAIDLDWLRWFGVPGLDPVDARRIHLENLRAVADAYALAGAVRLVIAGSVRSTDEVAQLRAALPFSLRIVRLSVPLGVIEQRLSTAPTHGRRAHDARTAARWLREGVGADVGDLVVDADGPLDAVTDDIAAWLGWP